MNSNFIWKCNIRKFTSDFSLCFTCRAIFHIGVIYEQWQVVCVARSVSTLTVTRLNDNLSHRSSSVQPYELQQNGTWGGTYKVGRPVTQKFVLVQHFACALEKFLFQNFFESEFSFLILCLQDSEQLQMSVLKYLYHHFFCRLIST